jgi:hypothetical protein
VLLVDTRTGAAVDPVLVDRVTGRPITGPEYALAPGPAAGERTRRRFDSRVAAPGSGTHRPVRSRG